MAVWQFDLCLIGQESAPPFFADMGWESPGLPARSTLGAQDTLIGAFGFPWLMMDDWVVFGTENGTRVDFIFDEQYDVQIHIRIDASAVDPKLDAICAFADALRGRLFDPTNATLISPDTGSLATALAASRAGVFSQSPSAFLSRLKKLSTVETHASRDP